MTVCSTPSCDYPTPPSAFVCKICVQAVTRDLASIPALIDDLHTTMTRQDRLGASGGRRGAETALPWKPTAAEALWVLSSTILEWVRGYQDPDAAPFPDAPKVAAYWLLKHLPGVVTRPDAGQMVDEIAAAAAAAYVAIDRAPDKLLAGLCNADLDEGGQCEDYLYASVDGDGRAARIARCRSCGAEHSFDERRAWMLGAAAELHLPANTALAWVRLLMGKSIPRGTWDSWVARGQVAAAERDHVGNPLYRFGDVRDRAAEWVARPRKGHAA